MKIRTILLSLWIVCAPAYADEETQLPANPPKNNTQSEADYKKSSCEDDAVVGADRYSVANNNVLYRGSDADAMQCIGPREWIWQWAPNSSQRPHAFPSLLYGFKPFYPASTTPDMPIRLSEMGGMSLTFNVRTEATGSYNLQISLWITDGKQPVPTRESVKAEVNIWLDSHNMKPQGKPAGKVTIKGTEFGVWKESAGKVARLTYVAMKPMLNGTLVLSDFLSEFPQDQLLASIELGNLLVSGNGSTVVRKFSVK